jgi:hypothetical protein
MGIETGNPNNYGKAGINYYAGVVVRKITNLFLDYPEFIFIGKIFLGVLALVIFVLLVKYVF